MMTEEYYRVKQKEVLDLLKNTNRNIFLSGSAGTGKTYVIKKYLKHLKSLYENDFSKYVGLTSSTGISACLYENFNAVTIHSWSGIGINLCPINKNDDYNEHLFGNKYNVSNRIRNAKVLIIDEISMLPSCLLDKIDVLFRKIRNTDKPFGGIRVIFVGDFSQLPPIKKEEEKLDCRLAIFSDAWKNANILNLYLYKSYRTSDKELTYILDEIGRGNGLSVRDKLIEHQYINPINPNKVYATLFTTNFNVEKYNEEQQKKINREPYIFIIEEISQKDENSMKELKKKNNILDMVVLKNGDTVMVTKNIYKDKQLLVANGTIAKIISISKDLVRIRTNDFNIYEIKREIYKLINYSRDINDKIIEEELASCSQIPLKLAYAITVHKSQGQTFDGVVCDLSKCFVENLGYVALSRASSLNGIVLKNVEQNTKSLQVSKESLNIKNKFLNAPLLNENIVNEIKRK